METNITINAIELASNLAHERVLENFLTSPEEDMRNLIFVEEGSDSTIYSSQAQEVFNEWFDIYYTMIEEIAEKDEGTE